MTHEELIIQCVSALYGVLNMESIAQVGNDEMMGGEMDLSEFARVREAIKAANDNFPELAQLGLIG